MMNAAQLIRLTSVQKAPWTGMLNYFRTLKAEWDALEALGYVSAQLLSTDRNAVEVWQYAITNFGLEALAEVKRQRQHG